MKKIALIFPLLLSTALITACSNDNTTSIGDKIKTEVAQDIERDMNKAISEAKIDLSDISVTLKNGSKASIAANGNMTIDGKAVTLNDQQRALSKSYYDATKTVALHGIEIGKESAKLATQAVGSALNNIFSSEKETTIDKKVEAKSDKMEGIEKTIEAKASAIEVVAQKLCASAMELNVIQEKLSAAVPAFVAEPMEVVTKKDGCSVNSSDTHVSTHSET